MEIRKAGTGDLEIIADLAVKIWYPAYSDILSQEQITYMLDLFYSYDALKAQLSNNHQFLILSHIGTDIGFASFEPDHFESTAKLHKLYVLPQEQGTGAGRLLVAEIEKLVKQHGNTQITLNVNRYNKAYGFYMKNGYKQTGSEDIDIGNGYLMEDYIMTREL